MDKKTLSAGNVGRRTARAHEHGHSEAVRSANFRNLGLVSGIAGAVVAVLMSGAVQAQDQALPEIKVNLPPSPSFERTDVPETYETGELSVFGLRKSMSTHLDKNVRVMGYLLEVYECPAELRACNESKPAKRKQILKGRAPISDDACRPCDQPHLFLADAPDAKKSRALVVAEFPNEGRKTADRLLTVGEKYIVSGRFAINSQTGFAASNGLIAHRRLEDKDGNVLLEGNVVMSDDDFLKDAPR